MAVPAGKEKGAPLMFAKRTWNSDEWAQLKQTVLATKPVHLRVVGTLPEVDDETGVFLKKSRNLSTLEFIGCKLHAEAGMTLGKSLAKNASLLSLNLSCNSLGNEGASHVAKALLKNRTLQHLNLAENFIGNKGAEAIGESLLRNETLQTLILSDNVIDTVGIGALCKHLEENIGLKTLDLLGIEISAGARKSLEALKASASEIRLLLIESDDEELQEAMTQEFLQERHLLETLLFQIQKGVQYDRRGFVAICSLDIINLDSSLSKERILQGAFGFDDQILGRLNMNSSTCLVASQKKRHEPVHYELSNTFCPDDILLEDGFLEEFAYDALISLLRDPIEKHAILTKNQVLLDAENQSIQSRTLPRSSSLRRIPRSFSRSSFKMPSRVSSRLGSDSLFGKATSDSNRGTMYTKDVPFDLSFNHGRDSFSTQLSYPAAGKLHLRLKRSKTQTKESREGVKQETRGSGSSAKSTRTKRGLFSRASQKKKKTATKIMKNMKANQSQADDTDDESILSLKTVQSLIKTKEAGSKNVLNRKDVQILDFQDSGFQKSYKRIFGNGSKRVVLSYTDNNQVSILKKTSMGILRSVFVVNGAELTAPHKEGEIHLESKLKQKIQNLKRTASVSRVRLMFIVSGTERMSKSQTKSLSQILENIESTFHFRIVRNDKLLFFPLPGATAYFIKQLGHEIMSSDQRSASGNYQSLALLAELTSAIGDSIPVVTVEEIAQVALAYSFTKNQDIRNAILSWDRLGMAISPSTRLHSDSLIVLKPSWLQDKIDLMTDANLLKEHLKRCYKGGNLEKLQTEQMLFEANGIASRKLVIAVLQSSFREKITKQNLMRFIRVLEDLKLLSTMHFGMYHSMQAFALPHIQLERSPPGCMVPLNFSFDISRGQTGNNVLCFCSAFFPAVVASMFQLFDVKLRKALSRVKNLPTGTKKRNNGLHLESSKVLALNGNSIEFQMPSCSVLFEVSEDLSEIKMSSNEQVYLKDLFALFCACMKNVDSQLFNNVHRIEEILEHATFKRLNTKTGKIENSTHVSKLIAEGIFPFESFRKEHEESAEVPKSTFEEVNHMQAEVRSPDIDSSKLEFLDKMIQLG